jgi:hypothetical protein
LFSKSEIIKIEPKNNLEQNKDVSDSQINAIGITDSIFFYYNESEEEIEKGELESSFFLNSNSNQKDLSVFFCSSFNTLTSFEVEQNLSLYDLFCNWKLHLI